MIERENNTVPEATHTGAVFEKWGEAARAGFQVVPDLLLKHQKRLGLNPTDVVVLLNVLMHWWYRDQKPYPRPTTVARRMGSDVRTVQRSLFKLEQLGLIERERSDSGATYVEPRLLVERLEALAKNDPDYLVRIQGKAA